MIKVLVLLVIAVMGVLFLQESGNPGLLEDFASSAGQGLTDFINWLGGFIQESDIKMPEPLDPSR